MSSNVPGYSDNNSSGPSNDDNPKELDVIPPFVSSYGMKNATNNYDDAVMHRATTFNFKTEPVEDRERRLKVNNSIFMKRCRDPSEICAYTYYCEPAEEDLQPEEMYTGIKTEPVDEVEENIQESSLYMETEPFDYLPVVYSESTSQINAFNPTENDLEYNRTQLSREPEEEIDQQVNIPIIVPLESNIELVVPEAIVSTNTNKNPASVQRRKRKKKDIICTPTRVSTRIKKPRIMFNI